MTTANLDDLKRQAAIKSVEYVCDGMVVGLGTGSTAKHMIVALGERVKKGLKIKGVPTSKETARLAKKAKIPLLADDGVWPIDVAIDGADQVDAQFNLIKG
ncbi:MAG TPA: ribose-5-phosphate isomerase A, partial [Nitrospiraceae bacterium]|nr:ribose-5-phosphate isomerase A [Nitrospiraceae bacterium]